MITIIHDSDLHFKRNCSREEKKGNADEIINQDPDLVIVTGDLTENGYDGKSFGCIRYGGHQNQLKAFKEQYYDKFDDLMPIYLCPGNHDRGRLFFRYRPVFNFVKKKHGGVKYSTDKFGIRFICCGLYPKPKYSKWLKKQLNAEGPNIIFFHYNLRGAYSDWWSLKDKEKFYSTIKDFNILAILVGHRHSSATHYWKPDGFEGDRIRVIRSGGRRFTVIHYSMESQTIT